VTKKDNTGFLLSSQNHDKSRFRGKKKPERKVYFTLQREKMVALAVMGW
jgi:hypothetical protein